MQRHKLLAAATALIVGAVAVPAAMSASATPTQQSVRPAAGPGTNCHTTINTGEGPSLQSFCVTADGNIAKLGFHGVEQIFVGTVIEGYVLSAGGTVKGYDVADAGQSGFQAPVISQPHGANTLPLTITRKTTDGSLQLTQDYSSGEHSLTISSMVKNLTNAKINGVKYFRWADLDAAGAQTNTFTRSSDAIVATVDGSTGVLMGTLTYAQPRTVGVMKFSSVNGGGFATCSPTSLSTPVVGDEAAFQSFDLGNIAPGIVKLTTTSYRRI